MSGLGCKSGFSLIELTAVLVILAVTASAVSWSLSDRISAATLDDIAGELAMRDRLARHHASQTAVPCVLRIDLSKGLIERLSPHPTSNPNSTLDPNPNTTPITTPYSGGYSDRTDTNDSVSKGGRALYRLPEGFRFARVRTPDRSATFGLVDIAVSGGGVTSDYSIKLTDPSGRTKEMMFVGLTGRQISPTEQGQIDAIMDRLKTSRPDAR